MFIKETGIPMPNNNSQKENKMKGSTRFLRSLSVGDSFLIDTMYRSGIYQSAIHAKIKVTSKKEGNQVRVWRVE